MFTSMVHYYWSFAATVLGSNQMLLFIRSASFFVQGYTLYLLSINRIRSKNMHNQWYFLIFILIGSMFEDFAWITKLVRHTIYPEISTRFVVFVLRASWAFFILQYQSFAIFLRSLLGQNKFIDKLQGVFLFGSSIGFLYLLLFSVVFNKNFQIHYIFHMSIFDLASVWSFGIFIISAIRSFYTLHSNNIKLPNILRKQARIMMYYLVLPFMIIEILCSTPLLTMVKHKSYYAINGLSSLLLTAALYYISRRLVGLRFLNIKGHVESFHAFNFINDFRNILERLGSVTNLTELGHLTQTFYKEAFDTPLSATSLLINDHSAQEAPSLSPFSSHQMSIIDTFLQEKKNRNFLLKQKILVRDEVSFTHFYQPTQSSKAQLDLLKKLRADILLPIYEKDQTIAYIIVNQGTRPYRLYNSVEQDEMVVFGNFIGKIINVLQHKNLNILIHKEKIILEQLYQRHQEISHYKETIHHFLTNNNQQEIGIITYRYNSFTFNNESAQTFIGFNPNKHPGHPLTHALLQVVNQVKQYKATTTLATKDTQGNALIISGLSNPEQNNVILTIYRPEVSDIVRKYLNIIQKPQDWHYLLFLETTKTGSLIHSLIPGSGKQLLEFKISLIKAAMSNQALVLEAPQADIIPIAEAVHHISMRTILHVIDLKDTTNHFETMIKLFGINPLFRKPNEQPLLEKLDKMGTLLIRNVHFLDMQTQDKLAQFLHYGFYEIPQSDKKMYSDVRVITTTNYDLTTATHEGKISKSLCEALRKHELAMPSLLALPDIEFDDLINSITEILITTDDFKRFLSLTQQEKKLITIKRPTSIHECKNTIHHLLVQKSKEKNVYDQGLFNPAYNISDPELAQVARLGKDALKDQKYMAILWKKFGNQSHIAHFLGVNRSSVNRRCREYGFK